MDSSRRCCGVQKPWASAPGLLACTAKSTESPACKAVPARAPAARSCPHSSCPCLPAHLLSIPAHAPAARSCLHTSCPQAGPSPARVPRASPCSRPAGAERGAWKCSCETSSERAGFHPGVPTCLVPSNAERPKAVCLKNLMKMLCLLRCVVRVNYRCL